MHEFDRFIRHHLKPQAYLRYGDDFTLFCRTRREAHFFRAKATEFLKNKLKMQVNPKNDVIVPVGSGLRFLGHDIKKNALIADKHTTASILRKINSRNIASYKALYLGETEKKQLDWILSEKYVDI